MGGTTYYNPYGPPTSVPGMGAMGGMGGGMPGYAPAGPPPGMAPPPYGMPGAWGQPTLAVPAMQQMAAAAAMMPPLARQGSGSGTSTPGA